MNMLMIPAITLSGNTIISVQAEEETNFSAENETDLQTLFNDAVEDAIIIEENEILPVISLAKGEEYSVCDEDGRILLYTFHKYPDSYPDGANVTLEWGNAAKIRAEFLESTNRIITISCKKRGS